MRLIDSQWRVWAAAALLVTYRAPSDVCVVLDDGTKIRCTCTLRRVMPDGSVIWLARPVGNVALPAGHVERITGTITVGDGLDLEAVMEGDDMAFQCPRCGSVSPEPNDVREGYCGQCHAWTRRGGRKR